MLPAARGPLEVLQFPNGSANLTYLLRVGPHELVLRRPPFGEIAPGAHDMKREFKVLSRLWPHFDRAPRGYLFCDDPAVLGADFFVMERRRGEVVRDTMPPALRAHPDAGRRLAFALVEAMADLHALAPAACGLADLGRPDGFVDRQLDGWAKRWALARPDDATDHMEQIHARLAARRPDAEPRVHRPQRSQARQLPVRPRRTPTA